MPVSNRECGAVRMRTCQISTCIGISHSKSETRAGVYAYYVHVYTVDSMRTANAPCSVCAARLLPSQLPLQMLNGVLIRHCHVLNYVHVYVNLLVMS